MPSQRSLHCFSIKMIPSLTESMKKLVRVTMSQRGMISSQPESMLKKYTLQRHSTDNSK